MQCQAEGPDVGVDIVLFPLDALGRHVIGSTGKGTRNGVDEFARHAEIAQLADAGFGEEDVGRFDVAVDDAAFVEIVQAAEDLGRLARRHLFRDERPQRRRRERVMVWA